MKKTPNIDPLAARILDRLVGVPEAGEIVLGGYLALQHHLDYRRTHDIDAWWRYRSTPAAEHAITAAVRQIAEREGLELRVDRFGETLSITLLRAGRKCFAFQIADRTVQLEPPQPSAWPPVLIESLADTIGSKMNALVDRGAPRDFLDIRSVVRARLTTAVDCWRLWSRKNPGQPTSPAKQKVLHHLQALETRRPLESITDPAEQRRASELREWFRREFLRD
jgi:hypothetical protein